MRQIHTLLCMKLILKPKSGANQTQYCYSNPKKNSNENLLENNSKFVKLQALASYIKSKNKQKWLETVSKKSLLKILTSIYT